MEFGNEGNRYELYPSTSLGMTEGGRVVARACHGYREGNSREMEFRGEQERKF
jgi:hypothetical protein